MKLSIKTLEYGIPCPACGREMTLKESDPAQGQTVRKCLHDVPGKNPCTAKFAINLTIIVTCDQMP